MMLFEKTLSDFIRQENNKNLIHIVKDIEDEINSIRTLQHRPSLIPQKYQKDNLKDYLEMLSYFQESLIRKPDDNKDSMRNILMQDYQEIIQHIKDNRGLGNNF